MTLHLSFIKEIPKFLSQFIFNLSLSKNILQLHLPRCIIVKGLWRDFNTYENTNQFQFAIQLQSTQFRQHETNNCKIFFKLSKKCFPKNHKLYKFFKKTPVKISFSSSRKMGSINSPDNWQILCPLEETYGYNCNVKTDSPLQKKCLTLKVVDETERIESLLWFDRNNCYRMSPKS